MGAEDGGDGGIGVDCAVGTIVWVRRRNGSWWPGRILGPEELSASHLMSPRSGTPVKLLGREDASVDWYNLEKSKRVKAFRCGEFDACIERAEASQGIPIKKREKYARREDAILHALELEKQQLENHGSVSNGMGSRSSGAQRRELSRFSSSIYTRDDDPGVSAKSPNFNSPLFSRKEVLSQEEEYVHRGKFNKQLGWQDENPESFPRMRGLQDFGLRTAPPKKKLSQPVTWDASRKLLDIQLDGLSGLGHMTGNASHRSSFTLKRKRPQSFGEDSLVKKRDRRRPLVQVLQSSAKLPVSHSFQSEFDTRSVLMQEEQDHGGAILAKRSRCVYLPTDSNDYMDNIGYPCEEMPSIGTQFDNLYYPGSLAEESSSSSELAEETESDSSETDYLEPDMEEDGKLMADSAREVVPVFRDDVSPAAQAPEDFTDLKTDEMPYISSFRPQDHQLMDASADAGGVSKWNMKGKRNIRTLTKRPLYLMDAKIPSIKGDVHGNTASSFKMSQPVLSNSKTSGRGLYIKKESHDGVNIIEKDSSRNQSTLHSNRRYPFPMHGVKDHGRSHSSFNDSDDDSHLISPPRPYWEEPEPRFDLDYPDRFADELDSMFVDVDIKVQNPSHQGEHVPFVSLMSRFNGKQILGHPVQIEILEDGSSSNFVSRYNTGFDENPAPPAFGRTAKRTVMHRVPRAHPSAFDDEDADLSDSDQETKPSPRKLYGGYFNHQARLAKKSNSQARRPQKKLIKRVNTSSQKTRTLSSLARPKRRRYILDGLIKPEGGIPLVTCVPVKVVFSRILESIGRPLSVSAHRARMSVPATRGLL